MARIRIRTALIALVGLLVVFGLVAETAGADTPSDEAAFVELINGERAAAGLPALAIDVQMTDIARAQSERMAAAGTIFHNTNLAGDVTGNWQALGENVGMGGDVEVLHRAFMDSPGHRANVLGDYDRVGIGIVFDGATIFVTEEFWNTAAPAPVVKKASVKKRRVARSRKVTRKRSRRR